MPYNVTITANDLQQVPAEQLQQTMVIKHNQRLKNMRDSVEPCLGNKGQETSLKILQRTIVCTIQCKVT